MPQPQPDIAAWRDHLGFLLPSKELLRPDEVATLLGCDSRTVLRLFDDSSLIGHDINAADRQRQQMRVRRDSLILFLAHRANYTPEDMQAKIIEVIAHQPVSVLLILQKNIREKIWRGTE